MRLRPLTDNLPKCLVHVGGEPILVHALNRLADCGLSEAVIVVGHCKDEIVKLIGDRFRSLAITYVDAPLYQETNNLYSLWEARDYCDQDLLLIEADVLFDRELLDRLLDSDGDSMAVAPYQSWHSGTVVRTSEGGGVSRFVMGAEQGPGFAYRDAWKTVNIYLLRRRFLQNRLVPALERNVKEGNVHAFYESVLRDLVAEGEAELLAVDVGDLRWYEVDDYRDLEAAEQLFAPASDRLDRIHGLHGSYWRQGFVDHSYLYNLYFPPDALLDELGQDLRQIVTNYPVGQAELARLLADWTGAAPERHVVANGGSELIRVIGQQLTRRLTIAVPSFNEYEEVVEAHRLNRFALDPETFELDVDAFAEVAIRSNSDIAVVVTPNNPTSISVPRERLRALAEQLSAHDCLLIVDESFIEFSTAGGESSLESVIDQHPNLVVLKSMSKVFGVAGLRLGYILTANTEFADAVRRRLPIWNINGAAEAFLRSLPRFRDEFLLSCERVMWDRDAFYESLSELRGLRVYRPDANFLFCRVEAPGQSAPEIVRRLFAEHNILVKDCGGKSMVDGDRYLRIASRTPRENERLTAALAQLLSEDASGSRESPNLESAPTRPATPTSPSATPVPPDPALPVRSPAHRAE